MDLGGMTQEHILYIPMVGLIFLMLGYTLGARSVRADLEKRKKRMKE
jgi:hypothetical protein